MSLLHAAVLVPFIFALAISCFYRQLGRNIHTGWFVLPAPVLLFVFFLTHLHSVQEGVSETAVIPWIPSLGVNFTVYLDGLGLLFTLLISGIGSLVVLYSIYYLDKARERLNRFYIYLLLFMGAMLGIVLSDNMIVLYGFWELTSISSFLLIAFWHQRDKSMYGAMKSMLITVFGGLAMLAGFILLYTINGTFSIRDTIELAGEMMNHTLALPAMLLILLGATTKSAQFPFHIWLPDAMEAPTPVSAYLHSATMVKAGIYLVARFSPVFAGRAEWFWIVSVVGLITLIYASFRALQQTDLKGLLAYSTISQLGLIMSLLGMGSASVFYAGTAESVMYSAAITAAIFHLINHAIFKGALFMVVGIVDHETGTRDLRKLGGLLQLMPVTFTVALIGTFSMAGLPPFSGFLSKEMFLKSVINVLHMDVWNMGTWGALFPVVAWLASVCTFVYSMIFVMRTFTGKLQAEKLPKQPHEAPLGMLISPVLLGVLAIVFGIFPNLLSHTLIKPAVASIIPLQILENHEPFEVEIAWWHGWTPELFMTMGIVVIGTLLYRLHRRVKVLNSPLFSRWSLNSLYDGGLSGLEQYSNRLTRTYMTGSVRHYLMYIFVFIIAILGLTMLGEGVSFNMKEYAPMSLYELVVILVLVLSTLAVPFARKRLTAIILTGAVGYMVTLFFVIFRAPDLALTQMTVETVSVALFLLCFYHLPKLRREKPSLPFKLSNLIIALLVGAVVTLLALAASGGRAFESISEFYLAESHHLAGGNNVVNVILVDFRGFDTLLEITVLGIAALGIYSLIKLKLGLDQNKEQARPEQVLKQKQLERLDKGANDVILRTVSKLSIVIIIIFSFYLFLSGHNAPGGGFIAALMSASALILLSMAFGMNTAQRLVPFNFIKVMAAGLLVAVLTGMGSFLFGAPFLSHSFGYFDLPLLGQTELATAVMFDLGVYLAVVGVTMTIIYSIGRDK